MPREIEIRCKAERDLRAIPKRDGERIAEAIVALRSGLAGDVKRLTSFTPESRLRVGDWRVLYTATVLHHPPRFRLNPPNAMRGVLP